MALREEIRIDLASSRREVLQLIQELQDAFDLGDVDLGLDRASNELREVVEEAERLDSALDRIDGTVDVKANVDASELENAERVVAGLDAETAEVRVNADASELENVERLIDEIDNETVTVDVDTEESSRNVDGFLSGIGPRVSAGIGGAILAGVTAGFADALSEESALGLQAATFGLSEEESLIAGAAAGRLYEQGFGEGRDEIAQAAGSVFQALDSFGESTAQIDLLTASALSASEAFGVDVTQSIGAASQLVRNDLAPDLETAFAIIVEGFQTTDQRGDDLLDTFNEYSSTFRSLGLDANDFLSLAQDGLNAGARDTDKIADSFKELGIRVVEETDAISGALDRIGLAGESVPERIAAGGPESRAAIDDILDGIRELESAVDQENVIRELFGAPGEDLTAEVILNLDLANVAALDVSNTLAELNENVDNTSRSLSGFGRSFVANIGDAPGDIRDSFGALFSGDIGGFIGGDATELAQEYEAQQQEIRALESERARERSANIANEQLQREQAYQAELDQIADASARRNQAFSSGGGVDIGGLVGADVTAEIEAAALAAQEARTTALSALRDVDLSITADVQQAYLDSITGLGEVTSAAFGSPFSPRIEEEDFATYIERFAELQAAIADFSENLFIIEASDIFSEDQEDTIIAALEAVGQEGGAVFAQQIADAIENGDETFIARVKAALESGASQAEIARIFNEKTADLDAEATITGRVEVDDSELQNLPEVRIQGRVIVDDSNITALENDPLLLRAQVAIDPIGGSLDITDLNSSLGFATGGFDKGGAIHDPTWAWLAEAGNPEAVIGGHHDPQDALRWLEEVNALEGIEAAIMQRNVPTLYGGVQASGAGFNDSGMRSALATMSRQLETMSGEIVALRGVNEKVAGSSEVTARSMLRSERRTPPRVGKRGAQL